MAALLTECGFDLRKLLVGNIDTTDRDACPSFLDSSGESRLAGYAGDFGTDSDALGGIRVDHLATNLLVGKSELAIVERDEFHISGFGLEADSDRRMVRSWDSGGGLLQMLDTGRELRQGLIVLRLAAAAAHKLLEEGHDDQMCYFYSNQIRFVVLKI